LPLGGLLLLGHLAIAQGFTLPSLVPEWLVTWVVTTFQPDISEPAGRLSALLLLGIGTVGLALLLRRGAAPAARLDMPADWRPGTYSLVLWAVGVVFTIGAVARFASGSYSGALIALWLVGLALFLIGCYLWDRQHFVDLRPRMQKLDLAIIAILLVAAAALVFFRLGSVPSLIWGDEGSFWLDSHNIAEGNWKPRLFAPGTYTFPVLSNYFQAAIIELGNESLFTWRATSAIASLVAIPPLYLLGRSLVGRFLAVGSVVLLISSPYFLAFSRIGYNNSQAIAPVVLAMYLLFVGLQRRSATLIALGAVSAGAGFYTYQSSRIAILIVVALIAGGWVGGWLSKRLAIVSLTLALLVTAMVALPQQSYLRATDPDAIRYKLVEGLYFHAFYGESEFPRAELEENIGIWQVGVGRYGAQELYLNPEIHARMLGRGVLRTLLAFDDSLLVGRHFITGSLGGVAGSVPLLLGVGAVAAAWRQPSGLLLLLWLVLAVVILSVMSSFPPQWTRMVAVLPAIALLSSIGIIVVLKPFERWIKPVGVIAAYTLIVGVISIAGIREYFGDVTDKFPPALDDVVAIESAGEESDTLVVGIYNDEHRLKQQPFRMREFGTEVEYNSVPLIDLPAVLKLYEADNRDPESLRFYFDNTVMPDALALLQDAYGEGEVRSYYNAQDRRIGGSFRVASP
jgi:4-amino-4-deoxy-L-arabinose transferase-like glycosyltransferase